MMSAADLVFLCGCGLLGIFLLACFGFLLAGIFGPHYPISRAVDNEGEIIYILDDDI